MTPVLEFEGTVEEIQARLGEMVGQRLHVTVRPVETAADSHSDGVEMRSNITAKILARADAMSPEERADLPVDLAEQHDHYVYGVPKR
jgi:hypothetical protein